MTDVAVHHAQADSDRAAAQRAVDRRVHIGAFAILGLLVYATLPWRAKQYFSDQLDVVVVAKTALLLSALAGALWLRTFAQRHGRPAGRVSAFAFLVVMVFFCSSALGSLLFGNLSASVKLSVRATVVALVIVLLLETVPPVDLVGLFVRLLTVATLLSAATGSMSYEGRLQGVIPPMHPNEIAFLAAVSLVYYLWRTVNVDINLVRFVVMTMLGLIIVVTASRTTTIAAAIAIVVVLGFGRRNPVAGIGALCALALAAAFTLVFTDSFETFANRGGASPVNTLGSRTIAWDAVLHSPQSAMQLLLGQGLAAKSVTVEGQWWDTQILDSSWISVYVQAGLVGIVLALILIVYTLTQAVQSGRPSSVLWISLLILVAIRSIFESGLFDTSTSFIVLILLAAGSATCRQAQSNRQSGSTVIPGSVEATFPRTNPW